MASITINIPDAQVSRVRAAFNAVHPKDPGETTAELVIRKIREYVVREVANYEAGVASETARKAAIADVQADVVVT
jgi:hypothetical protein